jgi:hypothetical protein
MVDLDLFIVDKLNLLLLLLIIKILMPFILNILPLLTLLIFVFSFNGMKISITIN